MSDSTPKKEYVCSHCKNLFKNEESFLSESHICQRLVKAESTKEMVAILYNKRRYLN